MATRPYKIELFKTKSKGKQVWSWHLRAPNGKLFATAGEPFSSKANATRAAIRMINMITGAATVSVKLFEKD